MKVAVVTSFKESVENDRIKEEVEKLGHEFSLNISGKFGFYIKDSRLTFTDFDVSGADVVIVRGILGSIKAIAESIKGLRKGGTKVFDNNLFTHLYSINKVTDLVKLANAEIPIPDTVYAKSYEDILQNAKKLGFPIIFKSTRAGKGIGIYKADSADDLKVLVEGLEAKGKEAKSFILQEFIDYVHDLRVLIIGDKVFTMKRIPKEGDFRANFSLGGSVEPFDLDKKGEELAKRALRSIGMSVGGVDILITKDDERTILEVNHSAGFAGMEEATGENIGEVYVKHAIEAAK